jgi:hypothetical protein
MRSSLHMVSDIYKSLSLLLMTGHTLTPPEKFSADALLRLVNRSVRFQVC